MARNQTLEQAVAKHVTVGAPDECWPAAGGGYNKKGWHVVWSCSRRKVLAHRAAWEVAHGQNPGKMFVLHRCDNPKCCNPGHLFLGTQADNARDMWAKGRGNAFGPPSFGVNRGRKFGPSPTRRLDRGRLEWAVAQYLTGRTQKQIAADLGITDVALSCAFRGETYPEMVDVVAAIQPRLGRNRKGTA